MSGAGRGSDGGVPAAAWEPEPAGYPEVFVWPPRPLGVLRWLPALAFPNNAVFLAVGVLVWWLVTPSTATMASLRPGWILGVLVRNAVIVGAGCAVSHWWLNVRRAQGTRTRFNPRWPAGRRGRTLGSQTAENVLFTMVGGVPLATAWEVVTLWLVSSGRTPSVTPSDNPIWFLALFPVIALFREVHFYAVHRLLHRPPLYRAVHSLHHRNTNPGPWSGLSMHPVEHLLYFSALALHWIVPSHPLHIIFHSLHLTLAPIPGHSGFERIELGPATYRTNGYAHYLHHKLFEVNYADGTIPLDRWFGTHHDGSPEADERLRRRRTTRVGRRPQGRGRAPS